MKLPQTPTIESFANTCAWLPEYSRRRPINTPPSEGQLSFIQGRHGEGGGCAEGGGGSLAAARGQHRQSHARKFSLKELNFGAKCQP